VDDAEPEVVLLYDDGQVARHLPPSKLEDKVCEMQCISNDNIKFISQSFEDVELSPALPSSQTSAASFGSGLGNLGTRTKPQGRLATF
jgi:hypothetical protein